MEGSETLRGWEMKNCEYSDDFEWWVGISKVFFALAERDSMNRYIESFPS